MEHPFLIFLDHTQRRTTFGRTPLDEWSARRRDLFLTTHYNHNRQISMPPGGIRTHNLSRWAAADLRLRPRGHWDRQTVRLVMINLSSHLSYSDEQRRNEMLTQLNETEELFCCKTSCLRFRQKLQRWTSPQAPRNIITWWNRSAGNLRRHFIGTTMSSACCDDISCCSSYAHLSMD